MSHHAAQAYQSKVPSRDGDTATPLLEATGHLMLARDQPEHVLSLFACGVCQSIILLRLLAPQLPDLATPWVVWADQKHPYKSESRTHRARPLDLLRSEANTRDQFDATTELETPLRRN
jgi:hypothetical protein